MIAKKMNPSLTLLNASRLTSRLNLLLTIINKLRFASRLNKVSLKLSSAKIYLRSYFKNAVNQTAQLSPQTKGTKKETNEKLWGWLRANHDVVAQRDSVIKNEKEDQVADKELGLH